MNRTFRLLAFAAAFPLALSACSSGTKSGDTNVETGSNKDLESNSQPSRSSSNTGDASNISSSNADSLTAGIPRDTSNRPTGKELYKAAGQAKDRNHDGLAD